MFRKFQMLGKAIKAVKPNVPKTKKEKLLRDLKILKQKTKASGAKLKQTQFELKNPKFKGKDLTFKTKVGKSESNKERYKRIQKENTKVFKGMIDDAFKNVKTEKKATGGRIGKMGGGMMGRRMGYSQGSSKGKVPTTPKEKSLAKLAPPKDRITFGDVVAGRTKGKRMQARNGTKFGATRPKPNENLDPNNLINIRKKKIKQKAKEDMK